MRDFRTLLEWRLPRYGFCFHCFVAHILLHGCRVSGVFLLSRTLQFCLESVVFVSWVFKQCLKYRKISGISHIGRLRHVIRRLLEIFGNFSEYHRYFGKFPDISYQSSPRTDTKSDQFIFLKKQIRCYLVI